MATGEGRAQVGQGTIAVLLPHREIYASQGAGAVSLCVRDICSASRYRDRTVVLGRPVTAPFGTPAFQPVTASRWLPASRTSRYLAGAAALLLAAGRTLSVPAKAVAGHLSDRIGPLATTGHLGIALAASGVAWVVAPDGRWGAVPAVALVAAVSAVFPIANVLAFHELGDRGPLLGAFRSVQMGAGAVAAAAIGAGAQAHGLRPALLASLAAPTLLVALSRRAGAAAGAG